MYANTQTKCWVELTCMHDPRQTYWRRGTLEIRWVSDEYWYHVIDTSTGNLLCRVSTVNTAMVRTAELISAGGARYGETTEKHATVLVTYHRDALDGQGAFEASVYDGDEWVASAWSRFDDEAIYMARLRAGERGYTHVEVRDDD